MRTKRAWSVLLLAALLIGILQPAARVQAFAYAAEQWFVLYQGGSFSGVNDQSGAINTYVMNMRLLSDDTKVYVEYKKSESAVKDTYYWVADESLKKDDGARYVVGDNILKSIYNGGGSIYLRVETGSATVQWPDSDKADYAKLMPYRYTKGKADSGDDEDKVKQEANPALLEAICEKFKLNKYFKDSKFYMYKAEKVASYLAKETGNDDLAKLFNSFSPDGFKIEDDGGKFVVSCQPNDEGNLEWRFAFPVSSDDGDDKDSMADFIQDHEAWTQYKDQVDLLEQRLKDVKGIADEVKAGKWKDYIPVGVKDRVHMQHLLNDSVEVETYTQGYMEIVTDRDFNYLSSCGNLAGVLSAEQKQYVKQYLSYIGGIPFPWFWAVNYDVTGKAQLSLKCEQDADGGRSLTSDTGIYANGNLAAQAGVGGYGMISVAGHLDASIDAEVTQRKKLSAKGKAYLEAMALRYYKKTILQSEEYSHTFFDVSNKNNAEDIATLASLDGTLMSSAEEDEPLTMVSRDFLKETTSWNGREPDISQTANHGIALYRAEDNTYTVNGKGVTGTYLQQSTMQGSTPQIVSVGDKDVLFFFTMDADGKSSDAGRLMYSVKENGTWSEPAAVWDNGQADYYADAREINGNLYLTWQKAGETIAGADAEEQLVNAIAQSEICVATFDTKTNTFVNPQYITDNVYVDMLPQIVCNGSKPAVAWISNTQNAVNGAANPNAIVYSELTNDAWTQPATIASVNEYIGNYVVYQQDNAYHAVYVGNDMSDCDETTTQTATIHYADMTKQIILEQDKQSILGLQYCNGSLYWLSDGILTSMAVDSDTPQTLVAEAEAASDKNIGADFVVVSNNEKTSIVWSNAAEDGYSVSSVIWNGSELSNRITLYEHPDAVMQSFHVALKDNGNYDFVIDEMTDETTHAIAEVIKELTDTFSITNVDMTDLNRTNSVQSMGAYIHNDGETTLDHLHIKVTSGQTVYYDKALPQKLEAGQGYYLEDSFQVTKIQQPKQFQIYVYQKDVDGNVLDDTMTSAYEVTLGRTNLSLTMDKVEKNGKLRLKCKVTNESDTPSAGKICLYDDINATHEIDSVAFEDVAAGASDYLYFNVDPDRMTFQGDEGLSYQAKVITDITDYQSTNNKTMVVFYASDFDSEDSSSESGSSEDATGEEKSTSESGEMTTGEEKSTSESSETTTREEKSTAESSGTTTGEEKSTAESSETTTAEEKSTAEPGKATTVEEKTTAESGKTTGTAYNSSETTTEKVTPVSNGTTTQNVTLKTVVKFKGKPQKNKITLTWKKSSGISGYQLQVSRSKKFRNSKTYSLSAAKKKYTVRKVTTGRTYYIRIRTFKKTRKDGQLRTFYSKYKTLKVKSK